MPNGKTLLLVDQFHIFLTVKFRKDLRKLELKISPSLKSVAALPCETFISVRIICFMAGGICFISFFCLFIFLPDTDVIMTLLQYLVCCINHFLSVIKINVLDSIEQRTIDTSIDQWHSRLKTRICAKGEHFKYMT